MHKLAYLACVFAVLVALSGCGACEGGYEATDENGDVTYICPND